VKRLLAALLAAAFLAGCAKTGALNAGYDLRKIRRIGVADFDVPPAAGHGVEDLFAKQLLDQGYDVVERARLDAVVRELNLGAGGMLAPDTAKKVGKVLGVDALLAGEISHYEPARRDTVVLEGRTRTEEPVVGTFLEKNDHGAYVNVQRQVGTTVRREITQTPQTFVIDAHVGVVAKLVDAETGEIIWAGSTSEEAVDPLSALDEAAATLAKKMKKQWDAALRRKASAAR
jgi:hypothetical protein